MGLHWHDILELRVDNHSPYLRHSKLSHAVKRFSKVIYKKTEKHWNSLVFILISYFFLQLMDFENFPTICLNFVCSWNGEWFPTCNSILWLCDFSSCPKQMKAVDEFLIFLIISIFLCCEDTGIIFFLKDKMGVEILKKPNFIITIRYEIPIFSLVGPFFWKGGEGV